MERQHPLEETEAERRARLTISAELAQRLDEESRLVDERIRHEIAQQETLSDDYINSL